MTRTRRHAPKTRCKAPRAREQPLNASTAIQRVKARQNSI
nr:MAG TPA_asm: hypothetical protein [Caudoviricetes sp.]